MATHSYILAWRIPWTEEPGRLQFMGSQKMWSSLGPPAVLLVATNTPNSTLSVNWSLLLSSDPDGGLMVLPEESIQFSSALVFTRVSRLGEIQGEECRGEGSF